MNKYHAKRTLCFNGHMHHSRFEAEYCNMLYLTQRSGHILKYETQVSFDLGAGIRHVVDFVVYDLRGKKEVRETKGVMTQVARMKMKLFKTAYPDIPYRVITKEGKSWTRHRVMRRS